MKTNTFKKVTAILLSTTMIFASGLTAFASSDPDLQDTDPVNGTTEGAGAILDYRISTVVVPTDFKLAVNPNGYDVNLRYTKVASDANYSGTTKYYSKGSDGKYSIVTDIVADGSDANWTAKKAAGLYTAVTSDSQIVTFNYAIASKATLDRKVAVSFEVSADEEIEFVDDETKATAQTDTSDEVGAKPGEYKVYLKLIPAGSAAEIGAATKAKATTYTDEDTEYYTWDDTNKVYSEPTTYADEDAFKAVTADKFVDATTIGPEIKSKELADVTVSAKSTAPIAFEAGKGTTSADVTFVLPKAERELKATEFLDTNVTVADLETLKNKFELKTVAGVSAFTIEGTMNEKAQWNALTNKAITVTPTYDITDATGFEEAIDTGKYQVVADAKTYTVTYKPNFTPETGSAPADIEETVTVGEKATGKKDGEDITFEREGYTLKGWGTATDTAEADKVTVTDIDEATTLYAIWERDTVAGGVFYDSTANEWWIGVTDAIGFDNDKEITSVTVNGQDIDFSTKAFDGKQFAVVTWSGYLAAGYDASETTFDFEVVVSGTTYTAQHIYE